MNRKTSTSAGSIKKRLLSSVLSTLPLFLWIVIITSVISILGFIFFSFFPNLAEYFFLIPANSLSGKYLWTLLTHIFFHTNLLHLFLNMFSLFFIGSITESIIGKRRFFWFYIFSGIFAGIFFILLAMLGSANNLAPVLGDIKSAGIGASGALFGLLGILVVLIPRKKVYLVAGPIILIILQILLSSWFSGALLTLLSIFTSILLFLTLFSLFLPYPFLKKLALHIEMPLWAAPIVAIIPLVLISFYINLPIGNSAHLGGLICGLIYGIYLRLKYPRKISLIERYIR